MLVPHALHVLRQSRTLARWVLACFALALTLAVAAPLVKPQAMTLVCSTLGQAKWVQLNDNGDSTTTKANSQAVHHTLDCVLCLALDAPPAHGLPALASPLAQADHIVWPRSAHTPHPQTSKLAARAPPVLG